VQVRSVALQINRVLPEVNWVGSELNRVRSEVNRVGPDVQGIESEVNRVGLEVNPAEAESNRGAAMVEQVEVRALVFAVLEDLRPRLACWRLLPRLGYGVRGLWISFPAIVLQKSITRFSAQKRSSPGLEETNATWPPRSVASKST
jgi:hypothetical protein